MTLAILLFFLGLGFVVAEVFFTSFGVLGILAAGCLIGSVVLAFQESQTAGMIVLGTEVVAVPVIIVAGLKVLPRTPIGRALILDASEVSRAKGFPSGTDQRRYFGKEGVTLSALRPAGVAEIDGNRVDVVTEGEMIPMGARVRVIHAEGTRIVVQQVSAPPPPGQA